MKNSLLRRKYGYVILALLLFLSSIPVDAQKTIELKRSDIICGADRTEVYLPLLADKSVGIVANPTSMIGSEHLVDSLISLGVDVKKVFSPEHGFRGDSEAGAIIDSGKDEKTGIQVVSLYTGKKKPEPEDLEDLDLVVYDIQDVGARFYTYISTLHYVMEACEENHVPLLLLDRPNPNGFYVDGPILDLEFQSFVGMHPIPVVHGMTIGELAGMINGESWLKSGKQCDITTVKCVGWDHQTEYILPVKPSPNLPNQRSIYLYPSLCFFEGTVISIGRGTLWPFQVVGHPDFEQAFSFTPEPVPGASLNPKHKGVECYGFDLRNGKADPLLVQAGLDLSWLVKAYHQYNDPEGFFNNYFNTLAGGSKLRDMIQKGLGAKEIRESWQKEVERFKSIREKYLLYPVENI